MDELLLCLQDVDPVDSVQNKTRVWSVIFFYCQVINRAVAWTNGAGKALVSLNSAHQLLCSFCP